LIFDAPISRAGLVTVWEKSQFERMGIKKWQAQLEAVMINFSKAHNVDIRGLDN